ncbi:unnamed protein product [Spodoptera littoralis]|uniref:Uncharacterized protein n=1 Tax=Spodoptera littoralis TaxID=7109 RepID=A0A9P0I161_SPOLI|nr:unnamed protein product [Spodoptera littoralis]CAH1637541.1 unnamed protein product [Spodoptera littoralis]
MAAFACFSNSNEKTTASYRALIQRLRDEGQKAMANQPPIVSIASFKFYSAHKEESRHVFKDFIYKLRMKMFEDPYILLCDNPTPIFKCFVRLIQRLKLRDGVESSAFYGEIKKVITGFMNYFTFVIDDVVKKIDKYTHILDNKLFTSLIDETMEIFEKNQAAFLKEYSPIKNDTERANYNQVIEGQEKFMAYLEDMRVTWKTKQDKFQIFVMGCFQGSLQKMSNLCNFAHSYLSIMLADRLYEISVSLGEIVDRMNTNMRKYNEYCTEKTNELIQNLYDKNKEHLEIYRRLERRSVDSAEVSRTIDVLREKIEQSGNEETIARLELETRYWNKRMRDFNEIATILIKIRMEQYKLQQDLDDYKTITCKDLPGTKTMCFDMIGENLRERLTYLQRKELDMARTLITYFCVRGTNRILYTDSVGSYYCDEFNHQNYITNYGLKYFHVNCYGDFLENLETEPYYFDEHGRYVIRDGEKFHQCAPCTSLYKMGDNGLFKKVTKDCGHSERANPNCRLEIKDLTDVVILPKNDHIDITGTLDGDSVKFLWDSFGMILPEVLYAVATKQPKNPIHFMAHILINRRFEATKQEFGKLAKKADKYRTKFHEERKQKAKEERQAWKTKLIKYAKAGELDDTHQQRTTMQRVHDLEYLSFLEQYY